MVLIPLLTSNFAKSIELNPPPIKATSLFSNSGQVNSFVDFSDIYLFFIFPVNISRLFLNPLTFLISKLHSSRFLLTKLDAVKVEKEACWFDKLFSFLNKSLLHISLFLFGEKPSKNQVSTKPFWKLQILDKLS